jgi:hypothetical protein
LGHPATCERFIRISNETNPGVASLPVDQWLKEGFRLRGSFDLRRGHVVELILDEDPLRPERCSVIWVGKTGSKQEGEVGLETI